MKAITGTKAQVEAVAESVDAKLGLPRCDCPACGGNLRMACPHNHPRCTCVGRKSFDPKCPYILWRWAEVRKHPKREEYAVCVDGVESVVEEVKREARDAKNPTPAQAQIVSVGEAKDVDGSWYDDDLDPAPAPKPKEIDRESIR